MPGLTDWFDVFRVGTHIDRHGREVTIGAADIDRAVELYTPNSAPIVVGHPTLNAPAYGWVDSFRRIGDLVQARASWVDPEFAELVQQRRYKNRSLAFGPGLTFRHVGFLGAVPPAVKGLREIQFSTEEETMDIEFSDDTQPPQEAVPLEAQQPQEPAAEPAPEAETPHHVDGVTPEPADTAPSRSIQELEGLQKQLEALKQQLAQSVERETRAVKAWQTERAKSRRIEFAQYAGELVSAGKMPPTAQTAVCEFMAGLDSAADAEFAEGDAENPLLTQFKELLTAVLMPRPVEFAATLTADAALDGTPETPAAMAARIREQRVALRAAGKHANISQVMQHLEANHEPWID